MIFHTARKAVVLVVAFTIALAGLMALAGCASGPGPEAVDDCDPCRMVDAANEGGGTVAAAEGGLQPNQAPDSRKMNFDPNAITNAGSGESHSSMEEQSEDQTTTGAAQAIGVVTPTDATNQGGGGVPPDVLEIRATIRDLRQQAKTAQAMGDTEQWQSLLDRIERHTELLMAARADNTKQVSYHFEGAKIWMAGISTNKSGRGEALDPETVHVFADGSGESTRAVMGGTEEEEEE